MQFHSQGMQVPRKGAECAHRRATGGWIHCRHVHRGSDVDRGRTGMDHLQVRMVSGCEFGQDISSVQNEGRGLAKFVIFLSGITATAASPLSSAHQPMCHVF